MKTYVLSARLYGSEYWTINEETEEKNRSSGDVVYQKNDDIMDRKKSNELILKEAISSDHQLKPQERGNFQFLNLICRLKDLENLAITGKIGGKGSRGRRKEI
ncbi:hypothetical protein PoB_002400700 [Plakobranchus ocellatus]|uniref:Uncharacterized protein n=1 Tax=Plakobranchus ocellatus TaxID=259542 RepID=A0AAV3ZQP0_9GAST|nr:hypothetical protein PoB_002400700 [Plakobranchus ocellatus]